MITFKAIDHLNIIVNDLDKSIYFYKKIFGFEIVEDSREEDLSPNKLGTPYVVVGIRVSAYLVLHQSLQKGNGQESSMPIRIAHFGLHVDDFDTIIAKLKAFAVTFLYGEKFFEWPHSRSLYILDPSGHEIELVEHFGGREKE
jgi:catechol 2,3-dioxygenase-like lactoylglutathione lyase family enzyme